MDWDRAYEAAMVAGILIVIVMVAWCVLAALLLILMAITAPAIYIFGLAAWLAGSYYLYNSDHLDED